MFIFVYFCLFLFIFVYFCLFLFLINIIVSVDKSETVRKTTRHVITFSAIASSPKPLSWDRSSYLLTKSESKSFSPAVDLMIGPPPPPPLGPPPALPFTPDLPLLFTSDPSWLFTSDPSWLFTSDPSWLLFAGSG